MTKISIIMPIYNDSELLDKSISSLLNQTLDDFEIVCVDDGSTDNSLEILNGYASKYNFIKVFSQENQGPGKARNYGISKAEGDYIGFLDADDYFISNYALEQLYDVAVKYNSNMVAGNIKLVDGEGNYFPFTPLDYYTDYGTILPEDYGIPWAFYKNIYKNDFLTENGINFPDLIRGEDPVFLAEILSKVDVIHTVPVDVYAYYYIDGFVKINTNKRIYDHITHYKMVHDYLSDSKFKKIVHKFRHEMMWFIDLMGPERAKCVIESIRDIFNDDVEFLKQCEDYFYLIYKDNDDLNDIINFTIDSAHPRISVVMPMDETDNYFEQSINSILNQTFEDFEIICYNDFNDNPILNDLAIYDSRVKIYNDISSPNDAVKIAKGEYVYFFHPKANLFKITFEELYKNAISNDSDIVLFMLSKYLDDNSIDFNNPIYNLHEYFDGITYHHFTFNYLDIKEYLLGKNFVLWNRFYKKEFLEKYDDFIIDKVNEEDILFNVKTMLRADAISFAADYYYRYRGQNYLALNSDYDIFSVIDDVEKFLKKEDFYDELENEFYEFKINQIILYLESSQSREYFDYSKNILLELDNKIVYNLSEDLLGKYYFVIDSDSVEEYKFKSKVYDFSKSIDDFNKMYDIGLANKELLNINQFLFDENKKLNKKIAKLTKKNKKLTKKIKKLEK